ncbi:hypothetical protein GGI07_003528 [Coemansia sp. Benny D115]|nr:hypothetical protein GGI07_003528 [Coemansia sp. Benny D115]
MLMHHDKQCGTHTPHEATSQPITATTATAASSASQQQLCFGAGNTYLPPSSHIRSLTSPQPLPQCHQGGPTERQTANKDVYPKPLHLQVGHSSYWNHHNHPSYSSSNGYVKQSFYTQNSPTTAVNTPYSEQSMQNIHNRLRQRLDEVLEDNARLAALLEDAQLQIRQLKAEKESILDRFMRPASNNAPSSHTRHTLYSSSPTTSSLSSRSLSPSALDTPVNGLPVSGCQPAAAVYVDKPPASASVSTAAARSLGLGSGCLSAASESRDIPTPLSAPASMAATSTRVASASNSSVGDREPRTMDYYDHASRNTTSDSMSAHHNHRNHRSQPYGKNDMYRYSFGTQGHRQDSASHAHLSQPAPSVSSSRTGQSSASFGHSTRASPISSTAASSAASAGFSAGSARNMYYEHPQYGNGASNPTSRYLPSPNSLAPIQHRHSTLAIPERPDSFGQSAVCASTESNLDSDGMDVGGSQRPAGKRRKRHHDIASKVRSVQPVPRDKNGNYEMPVQVGILTVLNLGHVVWDCDAYHNERYIWPVGYTVQREYYSMTDPNRQVIYTCWITDGGDAPLFHVEAEDMNGSPIVAPTATGAWTTVLRKVNQIRQREHSNSASGPDYFGFSHPTIAKMIQDLPDADRCRSYIMQHFVEMKDRHVRGVIKKGRGGRPSVDMLSRGQRALMASSSLRSKAEAAGGQEGALCGDTTPEPLPSGYSHSAKRISVATLTNSGDPSDGSLGF